MAYPISSKYSDLAQCGALLGNTKLQKHSLVSHLPGGLRELRHICAWTVRFCTVLVTPARATRHSWRSRLPQFLILEHAQTCKDINYVLQKKLLTLRVIFTKYLTWDEITFGHRRPCNELLASKCQRMSSDGPTVWRQHLNHPKDWTRGKTRCNKDKHIFSIFFINLWLTDPDLREVDEVIQYLKAQYVLLTYK